ncbi:MAG: M23 family metallopeptidase [Acidobacteria bacterium]|nr:M23 family metallopeptidase [Acidobacteriota bacterium]
MTFMLVLNHRTFRWSLTQRMLTWILGVSVLLWFLGVFGSGYGWWATKKIMSFSRLQQETQEQQRKMKATLEQAKGLEDQVKALRQQQMDLLKALDPKSQPQLPPVPQGGPHVPAPPGSVPQAQVQRLQDLQAELTRASEAAARIQASLDPIMDAWSRTPSVAPTAGYITSGFGVRLDPFGNNQGETNFMETHTGVDIANSEDTPIQATADGVVEQAGWINGYGNAVTIRHTAQLETLYGHMDEIKVKVGQQVSRGDIVGLMGHTGRATGNHCHYEVRVDGHPVNPLPYLKLQKQWLKALS